MMFDFWSKAPESLHQVTMLFSSATSTKPTLRTGADVRATLATRAEKR